MINKILETGYFKYDIINKTLKEIRNRITDNLNSCN